MSPFSAVMRDSSVEQFREPEHRQFARALELHRVGRLQDAAAAYKDVLRHDPSSARAWHLLGVLACQQGGVREGVELFRKAVEARPDFTPGWMDLGAALRELSDPQGAVDCFDRVLGIDPGNADAHNGRGEAMSAMRLHKEALRSYETAIGLNARDARLHNNAGGALLELGRFESALERFDHALSLQPRYARALSNRGSALFELGRFGESIAQFSRALEIQPDYGEARFNRGLARLLLGQFPDGWRDYEARLKATGTPGARDFVQPAWRGESDPSGKTILLHAEQGLGDTLQFCRYVPLVAKLGARVVLEVQRELVSLLKMLAGASEVVAQGEASQAFDLQCPLLSLPLAFGTDLSNIPSHASYLTADLQRLCQWQARLGPKHSRLRIGLAWSGGRLHKKDAVRNVGLAQLLDVLSGIDGELISLQKDARESDAIALAGSNSLRHFGNELQDFADTTALASLLDAVVTVDTSVAHLAAAIGKPTWILLPLVPDWRWLLDREDSPWYPTVRLFRQKTNGDWTCALDAVRGSLIKLATGGALAPAAVPQGRPGS